MIKRLLTNKFGLLIVVLLVGSAFLYLFNISNSRDVLDTDVYKAGINAYDLVLNFNTYVLNPSQSIIASIYSTLLWFLNEFVRLFNDVVSGIKILTSSVWEILLVVRRWFSNIFKGESIHVGFNEPFKDLFDWLKSIFS